MGIKFRPRSHLPAGSLRDRLVAALVLSSIATTVLGTLLGSVAGLGAAIGLTTGVSLASHAELRPRQPSAGMSQAAAIRAVWPSIVARCHLGLCAAFGRRAAQVLPLGPLQTLGLVAAAALASVGGGFPVG
ncbi:MAG TPA: hypothetical protein VGK54_08095 [Chloroflexota bacterium]